MDGFALMDLKTEKRQERYLENLRASEKHQSKMPFFFFRKVLLKNQKLGSKYYKTIFEQ